MIRRLLVTGGTGFIGRHALELLAARECEVHVIGRRRPAMPLATGITFHQADLHDQVAVRQLVGQLRPDGLLHLAWDVTPGEYVTSPENIRWVHATLHLMRAFIDCGGRRAVCAGTCAEYDWRFGYCSEGITPLAPDSPYAACKHGVAEILGRFACQSGLSFAWGRVFFLYGPQEAPTRLVPSVIRSALAGQAVRLNHPEQIRDYLHSEDVGAAFVALLFSDVEGAVNIASGEPLKLREIACAVFRNIGKVERLELAPAGDAPELFPLVVADVRRLRSEVGFRPRFCLETGIRAMVADWQQRETASA